MDISNVFVFFMDVVGFSLFDPPKQVEIIETIKKLIYKSDFLKGLSEKHLRLTGDGILLIVPSTGKSKILSGILGFACYMQKETQKQNFSVRIGLNYGNAFRIVDLDCENTSNHRPNYIGPVVNNAQRVMDIGNENHILLHEKFHNEMVELLVKEEVNRTCKDLGSVLVKHGMNIHVYNYVEGSCGNKEQPRRAKAMLIIINRIQDHLHVLCDSVDEYLHSKLCFERNISRVRLSILLHDKHKRSFFVSNYRYHFEKGNAFRHVKSEISFKDNNNNPVWNAFDKDASSCFQIPYICSGNPIKYVRYWTDTFDGLTEEDIRNFTRPSQCYFYTPISLFHPKGEKRQTVFNKKAEGEKIMIGVLCTDLMCEVPDMEVVKYLSWFMEQEARFLGYLLASAI